MKGQYKIISEVLLFAVGVALTSAVLITFNQMANTTENISAHDQLSSVADKVIHAIIRSVEQENTTTTVQIPKHIGNADYRIVLDGNQLTLRMLNNPNATISRQVFNINESHTVPRSEIFSSVEFVDIVFSGNTITMRRSEKIRQ